MFFVLSKTLNYLAMPLVIISLLFLISVFLKNVRWKRRLFWSAFGLLLFFSNDFIANEVMKAWEVKVTPFSAISATYDYGILLTGVTGNDREPADRVYFQHGADRVVHTVELYKRGIIKKVIISGGTGRLLNKGRKEAEDLFKAMILMGVPEQDMVIEAESRNTHESALLVKKILGEEQNYSLLLITSAFHVRRSAACFRKVDLQVETFSTDFYTHPRYFTLDVLLIPKIEALLIWQKLLKEWTGMGAYWMAGYI
jgi:uncharacterized SAM-binding protein YcdF (DUF218 family)